MYSDGTTRKTKPEVDEGGLQDILCEREQTDSERSADRIESFKWFDRDFTKWVHEA